MPSEHVDDFPRYNITALSVEHLCFNEKNLLNDDLEGAHLICRTDDKNRRCVKEKKLQVIPVRNLVEQESRKTGIRLRVPA